jgi:hypothetical protein
MAKSHPTPGILVASTQKQEPNASPDFFLPIELDWRPALILGARKGANLTFLNQLKTYQVGALDFTRWRERLVT